MSQMQLARCSHHSLVSPQLGQLRGHAAKHGRFPAAAPFAVSAAPFRISTSDRTKWLQTRGNVIPAGFEHLLADSALPVFKICGLAGVGAYCARQGMIDVEARRTLSKLAINVFTPALMISKLGAHIDLQHALALWPIGANVITCHLAGLALGIAHTKLLKTPPNLRKIIQVSTAVSNVGNLPLVMVMSFVKNPNLPFNTATEAELAVSYVMLGWFFATMIQMPLGHLLLHKDSEDTSHTVQQEQLLPAAATAASLPATDAYKSLQDVKLQLELMWQLQSHAGATGSSWSRRASVTAAAGSAAATVASVAAAQQTAADAVSSTQIPDALPYLGDASSSNSVAIGDGSSSSSMLSGELTNVQQQKWQKLQRELQPLMQGVMSPPLIAGLVAIAIGSCPPLRDALFTPGGSLSLLGDCCDMLGQPLIPVLLLVLGANLAKGPGQAKLPWQSVAGVLASRLVLLPVIGCMAVLGAQHSGLIDMQDPLTMVVMMVAWSTPTAILVHSLASIHKNGEDEVSALLFWEYLACIVTLPLCSAAYLYLMGCCMSYTA